MIVAANKIDLTDEDDPDYQKFVKHVTDLGYPVFPISAPIRYGVDDLLNAALNTLQRTLEEPEPEEEIEYFDFDADDTDPDYRNVEIIREDDAWVLTGKQLMKIFNSTNFNDFGSLRYLYKYIEKRGVISKLQEMGIEEGDTIRIDDYEFEYWDEY